jgi:hypothetical protein
LGLPKTWLGLGEDSNRASALVMNGPTHRTLENKQDVVKRLVIEILCFVRDQAEIAGAWSPKNEEAGKIDLSMPEMAKADLTQVSNTLSGITQAMAIIHEDMGLVTKSTVAKVVAKVLSEMGIVYDPDEELKAAEEERQEQEQEEDTDLATADAANKFLAQQLKMKQAANGNGAMMDDEEFEEE